MKVIMITNRIYSFLGILFGLLFVFNGNVWGTDAEWDWSTDNLSSTTKGQITMSYGNGGASTSTTVSGTPSTLRLYSNKTTGHGGWIKFTAASGYQITSVSVTAAENQSKARYGVDAANVNTAVTSSFSYSSGSATVSNLTASTFTIKNGHTGNNTATLRFSSITVTYSSTCDKSVTVSNGGSSANGSITSITTSPVATCSSTASDRRVSILVTPSTGYVAPTDLSVGTTTGTVNSSKVSRTDNGNGTFTFVYGYNQNDNGTISYNAACVGKQCTLIFNQNSGTGGQTSNLTATYGSAMPAISGVPTREHYDFEGYYDGAGGTGNKYYNSDGTSATNWNKNTTANTTLYAKWTEHGLKNYRTVCCTELGTIGGTVTFNSPVEAKVKWNKIDHVSSWTLKYKVHGAGAWSTAYTSKTSSDSEISESDDDSNGVNDHYYSTIAVSCGTAYDFLIIANPTSNYCDKEEELNNSGSGYNSGTWTVTSTGVTNATASPAIPSTTCTSGFSTTITAADGYNLPSEITVTNADNTWNRSTGALTISNVTGNVTITITPTAGSTWKFKYSGDSWEEHTMIEDAGVASYSISLDADSRFEFGFDGGSFYKNNGTIITTTSGWVFNTKDNNCHIHTGPAGTYTFAINTSTKAVTVTYPTVSHPNEHYVYFKNTNVWGTVYGYLANSGNDNKAAAWPGSVMAATTTICGETYHYAALNAMSGTYNTIIFNNGNSGYGNQTSDLSTTGSLGKYNANSDAAWHQFKYAISFDKGTGSGVAMSSIENLCPGSDQALTANTYTKEHNTFAGWIADVDVKVGESTIDAGEIIDDEVTIKDIQSDINLTAQWTPNTYTITKTLTNVANAGLPASFTYTGATTTALNSTFTVDATNFFLPSSIAVTMGGTPLTVGTDYTYNSSTGAFTIDVIITGDIVITATATAKLQSIAITTQPTTRKYFAGETFSSTGAVVTATMGDGSTKAVTASATWTPAGALSAGTGQTVTASYTEGGINQTATTTIDVYSVTVNKVNEDGDAIDVAGVTATWTVGTKALAAGVGSTKYAFKQWEVTGASIGSTSSANTTLSNPTANVVVNAVFWKPRVVKWSVNGNDSYNTGGPTTEVAYNGTISTIPTAPSGLVCASTFVAWTDAAHNNGQTAKASDSYYGSALYTDAGDFPNITAATTTFYAVFAEVPDEYYWSMGTIDQLTTGSGYATYDGEHTVKGSDGNNYTYTSQDVMSNSGNQFRGSSYCGRIYNTTSLGRITRIVLDYSAYAGQMKVYESDSEISSSGTTALTPSISDNRYTYNCSGKGYFIVIQEGSNAAKANVTVYFGDAPSNYVTECDANIVKVTYDANGGATSCTNTTTDKTEDFTVCSSAPTRDYYTFAGWLCSADDEVYAANATIDADAIDADFTLTAQWTPVTYTITYNYNGGSAQVDPAPATSYTVESSDITLQTPTYGHNRFEGWYENADLSTGGVKTTIAAGSHENKTYYAKWATRHHIEFFKEGSSVGEIWRADDEDISASVAGQGTAPGNQTAPSACSSKVFMGWSESTIDGETDDEPADLMKPAAGTVDEDKEFHAVWATESSESGTHDLVDDDFNVTGTDAVTSRSGWTGLSTVYGGSGSIRFSSGSYAGSMTLVKTGLNFGTLVTSATITFKIKKYGSDGSGVLNISSHFGDATTTFSKDGGETTSTTVSYSTTDGSNWTTCTCTVGSISASSDIILEGQANARVHVKDFKITYTGTKYTYAAYSTSCCATKVTLSDPSITDASSSGSTLTFDKSSPVWTCGGTKTVTAILTLTAGYQASALSFSVNSGTVSVSPAISTPVTSSQVYTLTFAEDQDATLTTTATIAAKPLNSITITPSSGEVYVGQYADFTVSYDPADYLSKGYTLNATPVYVTKESAAPANTKLRLKGGRGSGPGASITETVNETVTIKASGDNTKTASVNMTVNPLPRVHFEDLVHGKEFADVVATLSENALNPNKTTKTSVDWTTPNANTCEENHLHLVGWIRSDWPALVAYLNGTGDAPSTEAIVGAGNDGSGNAYFFAPNASINVLTFNGATFYAVWAEIK